MSIRFPNFNNNLNPARDDEDEVDYREVSLFGGGVSPQDGVFDLEIDPEKLGDLGNLGKKPEKRDLAPDDVVKIFGGPPPGWKPKYTSFKPPEEEEPPKEEEPQGLFDDVTDIDARQERERQAFADELAARKAEEIQRTEARAGLGGMGLSGATSELVGDVARQAERAGDIAMSDLERRQQQETFDELRRQASIWTFEEEFGVDLDGDGNYGAPDEKGEGGGAPGKDGGDGEGVGGNANLSSRQVSFLNSLEFSDLSLLDADSQPGTRGVPYEVTPDDIDRLAQLGITLTETTEKAKNTFNKVYGRGHTIYVDQYGNYYIAWHD